MAPATDMKRRELVDERPTSSAALKTRKRRAKMEALAERIMKELKR